MSDVVSAQDNVVTPLPSTPTPIGMPSIPNNDIGGGSTPYAVPRQIGSGSFRGIQTITGTLNIADPTSGNPISSINGTNGYQLFTDPTTQINQIIIGKLPDNSFGMVISKPGTDVLNVFST